MNKTAQRKTWGFSIRGTVFTGTVEAFSRTHARVVASKKLGLSPNEDRLDIWHAPAQSPPFRHARGVWCSGGKAGNGGTRKNPRTHGKVQAMRGSMLHPCENPNHA